MHLENYNSVLDSSQSDDTDVAILGGKLYIIKQPQQFPYTDKVVRKRTSFTLTDTLTVEV